MMYVLFFLGGAHELLPVGLETPSVDDADLRPLPDLAQFHCLRLTGCTKAEGQGIVFYSNS